MMEELVGSSFLLGASSLLVWSTLATAMLAAARPSSALLASAASLSIRFCLASAISCGKLSTSPNTCPLPSNKTNFNSRSLAAPFVSRLVSRSSLSSRDEVGTNSAPPPGGPRVSGRASALLGCRHLAWRFNGCHSRGSPRYYWGRRQRRASRTVRPSHAT